MIVRWGLDTLPGVLGELSVSRPLLITSERWRGLQLPVARRFHGVQPHADIAGVSEALAAAEGMDGLVALGGGSAIDTAKAVSSQTGLPIVSIPTTYSGAEWTQGFGMRDRQAGVKRGGGGAQTVAIVYEQSLTLGLPLAESAGTAMNALARCAEALYARGRTEETDRSAFDGARWRRWKAPSPSRASASWPRWPDRPARATTRCRARISRCCRRQSRSAPRLRQTRAPRPPKPSTDYSRRSGR